MDPFEMVVAIVFLCVIGGIVKSYFNSRAERGPGEAAQKEADELRDHIATLEDRIRVLERIVTDTTASGRDELRRQFRELER